LKITPTSVWGAGDYVVATGKIAGTNDGDMKAMKLKKTGKKVDMSWLEIDRFKDGKLAEGWLFYDGMAFANQLGLVPPPGAKDKGGAKK
jgi:predicted ester cyclase